MTIVKVVGLNKTELKVCNECANYLLGLTISSISFSQHNINEILISLLSSFEKYAQDENVKENKKEMNCPRCRMTYIEFIQTGRLGCSQCYETFMKNINPILGRLHENSQHTGKVPLKMKVYFDRLRKIKDFKNELQQAIIREEYESAAILRDKILDEENRLGIRKNHE